MKKAQPTDKKSVGYAFLFCVAAFFLHILASSVFGYPDTLVMGLHPNTRRKENTAENKSLPCEVYALSP